MKKFEEKINKKKDILRYVEELIREYAEKLEYYKEDIEEENSRATKNLLILGGVIAITSLILCLTANTHFFMAASIFTVPFLAPSIIGVPLTIAMTLSSKRKIRTKINEYEKLINVAKLREEYENQTIQALEEQNNHCNSEILESDYINLREVPHVEDEIRVFANNTHKIIRAKKSGKLKEFLCKRYNVTSEEALTLYENMTDLYLKDKLGQNNQKQPQLLRK